ncbi:MAG: hypothetical protein LBV75_05505 [Paludibacter sp.]|jgi:hypothetical protein|nr:hypothetical protein [Paludibacter sp.]
MKQKIKLLAIIALAIIAFTSCGEEELSTKQIFNFNVKANEWIANTDVNGQNLFYSCNRKFKNFNPGTSLGHCAVLAYISYGNYEQALPFTRHFEDVDGYLWTRTVDYDYSLDDINFYVTNSDFATNDRPESMSFRVVFIW